MGHAFGAIILDYHLQQQFGELRRTLRDRVNGMSAWPLIRKAALQRQAFMLSNGTGLLLSSLAGLWWAWLERLFVAPYWVNFHCEHHMFTQIPCWNLSLAHRTLRSNGVSARMELQPGYWSVLRLASSA